MLLLLLLLLQLLLLPALQSQGSAAAPARHARGLQQAASVGAPLLDPVPHAQGHCDGVLLLLLLSAPQPQGSAAGQDMPGVCSRPPV